MNKILGLLVAVLLVLSFASPSFAEIDAAEMAQYDTVPAGCTLWHKVREGYTCWAMAQSCGMSVSAFESLNNLNDYKCHYLQIGQYYCCRY